MCIERLPIIGSSTRLLELEDLGNPNMLPTSNAYHCAKMFRKYWGITCTIQSIYLNYLL